VWDGLNIYLRVANFLQCISANCCESRLRIAMIINSLLLGPPCMWNRIPIRRMHKTRQLCYRKDDRTMRPIYRCPENFGESLTTPIPLVSKIFNGLLLRLSLRMFRPNLKFIALSVPERIGVRKKIGQSLDTPTPLCLRSWDNWEHRINFGSPCISPRSVFTARQHSLLCRALY